MLNTRNDYLLILLILFLPAKSWGTDSINKDMIKHDTLNMLSNQHAIHANSQENTPKYITENTAQVLSSTAINNCNTKLKAAILVPQFIINDRMQLNFGQLQQLETVLSQHFAKIINNQSTTFFGELHATQRIAFDTHIQSGYHYRLPTWLTEKSNNQYILIPEITNLSMASPSFYFLGLWEKSPKRHFDVKFSLFHGISGEKIWSQSYENISKWSFDKHQIVNPQSHDFWQSAYGKSITMAFLKVKKDLDNILHCRPVLAKIIAKDKHKLILNLGRKHGVSNGDNFLTLKRQHDIDIFIQSLPSVYPVKTKLTVNQTTEFTSIIQMDNTISSFNIQLGDLAILQ